MQLRSVILVRHPPVAERHHGLCYGSSDVELSADGFGKLQELAGFFGKLPVRQIFHSGTQRTRLLAETLAERLRLESIADARLAERHFGTWELRSWDDIFAESGAEMDRVLTEPDAFRPGGGETTYDVRDRVLAWYAELPKHELTLAVTHAGPIAALLGTIRNEPVPQWIKLIPKPGDFVDLRFECPSASVET